MVLPAGAARRSPPARSGPALAPARSRRSKRHRPHRRRRRTPSRGQEPVSYTHLRAHETLMNL
eukprot:7000818-Prymnesium_polylepis.2